MHYISTKTAPSVFLSILNFYEPHLYTTRFSNVNYISQLTNLINVSSGFQLEELISGMNFYLELRKK